MSNAIDQMQFKIIDVTPSLAAEYLKRNISNRIISKNVISRYARDMKNNQWVLNAEAICIDCNGNLLNGQHRLNAVILSNKTVKMVVVTNVDNEAPCDIGYKRSEANNIQIMHNEKRFDSYVQADITIIATALCGVKKPTTSEHYKLFNFLLEDIVFVHGITNIKKTNAPLRAACVMALKRYNVSKSTIERFVEVFINGYTNNESENQAIALRNEYLKSKAQWNRGETARKTSFRQSLSSILSFNKGNAGKRLAKLREFEYPEIKEMLMGGQNHDK